MKTILVVDPDVDVVVNATLCLRSAGYDVLTASDGVVGTSFAVRKQPDAVVLDVTMSAGKGRSVAERLKDLSSTKAIPMILTTGAESAEAQAAAKEIGAIALLAKPCEEHDLLHAVHLATRDSENVTQ